MMFLIKYTNLMNVTASRKRLGAGRKRPLSGSRRQPPSFRKHRVPTSSFPRGSSPSECTLTGCNILRIVKTHNEINSIQYLTSSALGCLHGLHIPMQIHWTCRIGSTQRIDRRIRSNRVRDLQILVGVNPTLEGHGLLVLTRSTPASNPQWILNKLALGSRFDERIRLGNERTYQPTRVRFSIHTRCALNTKHTVVRIQCRHLIETARLTGWGTQVRRVHAINHEPISSPSTSSNSIGVITAIPQFHDLARRHKILRNILKNNALSIPVTRAQTLSIASKAP